MKGCSDSTYIFANSTVWKAGLSKASLWRSPHAQGHYHKSWAFHGWEGGPLAWRSSAALLPPFIFAPLTRNMGPLKVFINRIYFQIVRSGRNMESCYLTPIWHHPTNVRGSIPPFNLSKPQSRRRKWKTMAEGLVIIWRSYLKHGMAGASCHKGSKNRMWPG